MNFTISKKSLIIYGSLFGAAVILGIIIGCCVQDVGIGLYITLAVMMFGIFPYVKKMVLWIGRKAVDFATTLDIVLVMTILFSGLYYKATAGYMGDFISYWYFVFTAILYLVYATVKNYVLYLFIDMRDNLKKIADGKVGEETEEDTQDNTKKCPHCGAEIKASAKKCRFCGEWINEDQGNNQ